MPAGLGASACMQMNNTAAAPGMGKSVPSAYPSSSTSSGLHSPRPHFQETMSATLWFPKAQTSTLNHSKRPHHAPPAPMVTTSSWVNPYTENTNFRLLDHHKLAFPLPSLSPLLSSARPSSAYCVTTGPRKAGRTPSRPPTSTRSSATQARIAPTHSTTRDSARGTSTKRRYFWFGGLLALVRGV